jgi:dephospho-CoA kinase
LETISISIHSFGEQMKIIAFTGMPCSGKSEAVQIAKNMGINVFRMGDMVLEEVKNKGLPSDDKHVGTIANQMRKKFGKDIWAKKTLEKISKYKDLKYVVIDGIRNIEEIETFEKKLGNDFIVIAIVASDETRQKRFLIRGREDDSKDIQDLINRDKRELNWGLGSVLASADIVIPNEGRLKIFKDEIKKIFNKI